MAQNEYNLGKVLEQCRQSAAKGCELAVQQAGFFLDTLASARDKVQSMWKRWGCQLCFWKNSALSL